jgi:hypothetical protein
LTSQKISWSNGNISAKEQREIQGKAITRYRGIENPIFASWASEAENIAARDYFSITSPSISSNPVRLILWEHMALPLASSFPSGSCPFKLII